MKRKLINALIYVILILGLLLLLGTSCTQKVCPTYASAIKVEKQKKYEKTGGHMNICYYTPNVTKKEAKRSNKIWHSDFCKVKPKKR